MRIINSKFLRSAYLFHQLEKSALPEIAFMGKSNVGKSSLINALLNRKNLAQISKKPGKTRTINLYEIECFDSDKNKKNLIFADLPGYGFAEISNKEKMAWNKLVESYLQKRENLCGIVIIIDIRHPTNEKDIQAVKWVESFKKPFLLVATKSDKLRKSKIYHQLNLLKQSYLLNGNNQIIEFSAKNSGGKNKIINWIEERIQC